MNITQDKDMQRIMFSGTPFGESSVSLGGNIVLNNMESGVK